MFPIDWPEPFGLVMIEAMACGTPVIAFRSGSVPEVVDDGITGFVVDGEAEAVRAIGRLGELDRRKIRLQFDRRFTGRRMAEEYVRHYEKLVAHKPISLPHSMDGADDISTSVLKSDVEAPRQPPTVAPSSEGR